MKFNTLIIAVTIAGTMVFGSIFAAESILPPGRLTAKNEEHEMVPNKDN